MNDNPNVVSPNNNSKINFKILIGIVVGLILFQIYFGLLNSETDLDNANFVISISGTLLVGITSLFVAKKIDSRKFASAFYSLSVAFFSLSIAEVLYYYLPIIGIEPYPSIADVFFFLLYPFSMYHLIINAKIYQDKITTRKIIGMILLAVVITSIYAYFAFDYFEGFNFDFYYGLIFVAESSSITAVGIYGAIIARKTPSGNSWFLLVIGILFGTVADMWYQSLELLESYTVDHVVNLLWYGSYFVIGYSLYKYSKTV